MTDDSSRECGGEVNHSSSMSNPDPSRAALADERWYLGSMNDGLFIINRPPRPSNDDVWYDRPDGPTIVLNVTELPAEKAEAIVDAHNAALLALPGRLDCGAVIEQCAQVAEKRSGYVSCDPVFERGYYAGRELAAKEIRALPRAIDGGAAAKSLSDYSDAEIAQEYFWRAQKLLGDPTVGVGFATDAALSHPKTGDGK